MSGNNGTRLDSTHCDDRLKAGRGEVRSEVAVPDPEKGGTKVSGVAAFYKTSTEILPSYWRFCSELGISFRSAFRYEDTDDAQ